MNVDNVLFKNRIEEIARTKNPNDTPFNTSAPIITDTLVHNVLMSVSEIINLQNILQIENLNIFRDNEKFIKELNTFIEKYLYILTEIQEFNTIMNQYNNDNLPESLKGKDYNYFLEHGYDTTELQNKMKEAMIKILDEIRSFNENTLSLFKRKYITSIGGTISGNIITVPPIKKNYVDRFHENDPMVKETTHIYEPHYQSVKAPASIQRFFKIDNKKNSLVQAITTPNEIVDLIVDFDTKEKNNADTRRDALFVTTFTKSPNMVRNPITNKIRQNHIYKGYSQYNTDKLTVRNVRGYTNAHNAKKKSTDIINRFEEPESKSVIGVEEARTKLFVDYNGDVYKMDIVSYGGYNVRQMDIIDFGDEQRYLITVF